VGPFVFPNNAILLAAPHIDCTLLPLTLICFCLSLPHPDHRLIHNINKARPTSSLQPATWPQWPTPLTRPSPPSKHELQLSTSRKSTTPNPAHHLPIPTSRSQRRSPDRPRLRPRSARVSRYGARQRIIPRCRVMLPRARGALGTCL
jgi:hypothetical protein